LTLRHGGLSPLARGNQVCCALQAGPRGSIPACAGEPASARRCGPPWRVYPRLRGGTAQPGELLPERKGLSPLARGNRPAQRATAGGQRSIPACAGEPAA